MWRILKAQLAYFRFFFLVPYGILLLGFAIHTLSGISLLYQAGKEMKATKVE